MKRIMEEKVRISAEVEAGWEWVAGLISDPVFSFADGVKLEGGKAG